MSQCFYCEDGEKRKALMIEVCSFSFTTVYLNKNQKYQGRCVVKLNEHKTEYFELNEDEKAEFFEVLSKTAKAIFELYHPDKINYATFGDLVPHVHMHIVPKYQKGSDWGKPFDDTTEPRYLSDAEYADMIENLKNKIKSY